MCCAYLSVWEQLAAGSNCGGGGGGAERKKKKRDKGREERVQERQVENERWSRKETPVKKDAGIERVRQQERENHGEEEKEIVRLAVM